MPNQMPSNPAILKWARETAGLTREDVAVRLGLKSVTEATIREWENGKGAPTYAQLEKLAYKIYRRPVAVFFFPTPPQEDTPRQSFRTLPDFELSALSPRIRLLIRQATVRQLNLYELTDGEIPADRQILRDVKITKSDTSKAAATKIRKYLGISLEEQKSWQSPAVAFSKWRAALESVGIFIFKEAFKDDNVSGFCLYDDSFPVVFVNNSMPHTRQIFTLFHEVNHLMFGTGGIDTVDKTYITSLRGSHKTIEVKCNAIAGETLLPKNELLKMISDKEISEVVIEDLSMLYCVSREVVLRRLLDEERVSRSTYEKLVHKWAEAVGTRVGSGGNYYKNQRVYLGTLYLGLAFQRFFSGQISDTQLASYLGVRRKSLSGLETEYLRSIGA